MEQYYILYFKLPSYIWTTGYREVRPSTLLFPVRDVRQNQSPDQIQEVTEGLY